MTNDRLSNMLSMIKNAAMAKKTSVEMPHNKVCEEIAKVLKETGFIFGVKVFKDAKTGFKNLHLDIADENGVIRVTDVEIISKPGRRMYSAAQDLFSVKGNYIVSVVSTSRGVMSGSDARRKKLGGEVICLIR